MKRKIVSMLLVATMAAGMMAGCGDKDSNNGGSNSGNNNGGGTENGASQADVVTDFNPEDEGKVINIYSFNEELQERITAVYPEIVKTSKGVSTLKDGTEIHWIVNPNDDGVYQQKMDEAIANQESASADDKIDIFVAETDYVIKYTSADVDVALPLTEIGINPDTDLADQYDFTKTVASDENGVQRASTWQACPGVLVYRRDIAKDVWGTDDPAEIGEKTKDWETLKTSAEELKAKGYYVFPSYADTFRVYGNSISEPWVAADSTTVKVDQKMYDWVKDSEEWKKAGYFDKTVKGQWNAEWFQAMTPKSKAFSFLFPAWGIDTQIKPNWEGGDDGAWAVTNAPEAYNWGGTYVMAARGTDNPMHVRDIILALTGNADNLDTIVKKYSEFVNSKTVMDAAAENDDYKQDFLGGQNPYSYFADSLSQLQMAPLSAYDQGCVEFIQQGFNDYLEGQITFDKAKENFETAIKERYPEITEVQWPE